MWELWMRKTENCGWELVKTGAKTNLEKLAETLDCDTMLTLPVTTHEGK